MTSPDIDDRLDALYGGPLEEFVAARDALARDVAAAGDRVGSARIKRLRRPTVAAWVVNQVVRTHRDDVAALAALGDELRAATADRDRGRIKALDHLRRERTEALVGPLRASGEVAGRPVSTEVLDRLTDTLVAAVMDDDAAAVVRAGRLAQALQHVGFGIVDEGGEEADVATLRAEAPAAPAGPAGHADDEDDAEALTALEREVEATAAEVDRLEALRDAADARARAARQEGERHRAEADRLEAELDRLAAERDDARRAAEDARRAEQGARDEIAGIDDRLDAAEQRAAAARRARRAASR